MAISLGATNHAIRAVTVHCGDNLEVIKAALKDAPSFLKGTQLLVKNLEEDDHEHVNFGGMVQWGARLDAGVVEDEEPIFINGIY